MNPPRWANAQLWSVAARSGNVCLPGLGVSLHADHNPAENFARRSEADIAELNAVAISQPGFVRWNPDAACDASARSAANPALQGLVC